MNFSAMGRQRKLIFIAAVAGIVAMFLPWITISAGGIFEGTGESGISENGMHGTGVIVFLSFLGALALSLMGDQTKGLDKTNWQIALGVGAAALLFGIIVVAGSQTGSVGFVKSSIGLGAWIALLAAAGVLASAWVFRNPGFTLKAPKFQPPAK
jgi:amino acid transporter